MMRGGGGGGGKGPKRKITLPPLQSGEVPTLGTSPIPLLLRSSGFDTAGKIMENFHFKSWVERPCFSQFNCYPTCLFNFSLAAAWMVTAVIFMAICIAIVTGLIWYYFFCYG